MSGSIYDNPYKYAYECDVPIDLARATCKLQRKYDKMRYRAAKCPVCKARALTYESGDYWEGYSDFISCDSCGESFDLDEIKNCDLLHGCGSSFDSVLWFSMGATPEKRQEERAKELEVNTIEEWHKWAWQQYRRCNR